jgi:exopolysaccharide biosynthesis polyprenyl glycosylphosphotransferase
MRVVADLAVLYLASTAALVVTPSTHRLAVQETLAAIFPLLVGAILQIRSRAEEPVRRSALETTITVFRVVSLAAMLVVVAGSILGDAHPVAFAGRLWLFSLILLVPAQVAVLGAARNPGLATPTLIVGTGEVGVHLVTRLVNDRRYGLRPVGLLDGDPMGGADRLATAAVPLLGGPDQLREAAAITGARHVILAFSGDSDRVLAAKVRECQHLGLAVSVVPRLYECINDRATLEHVGGLPLLALRPTNPRGWQFAVKHALDRTVAFVALVVLAPLMVALAVAVRVSSPGPAFLRQRRVGRDGQEFDLLKFRTMREAVFTHPFTPPPGCAPGGVEGDDRRTRIGRFLRDSSLDELPQLINVRRGEMSLVGPRPERPQFVERFRRDVSRYEDRHRVKSGITGWAQVNGLRGQTSIADRVEWDNYYIQNWSLGFDLRILALTMAEVLGVRRDA